MATLATEQPKKARFTTNYRIAEEGHCTSTTKQPRKAHCTSTTKQPRKARFTTNYRTTEAGLRQS